MKMTETKKIKKRMMYVIIWVLFVGLTFSGIVFAYERTRFVDEGAEPATVRLDNIFNDR